MTVASSRGSEEKPGAGTDCTADGQAAVCLVLALPPPSHPALPGARLLRSHSWLSPMATRCRVLSSTQPAHQLLMVAPRAAGPESCWGQTQVPKYKTFNQRTPEAESLE
jgi:hypothetical protein